jgi:hypothetical protein
MPVILFAGCAEVQTTVTDGIGQTFPANLTDYRVKHQRTDPDKFLDACG